MKHCILDHAERGDEIYSRPQVVLTVYQRLLKAAQRGKGITLSREDCMVLYQNEDIRALGISHEDVC